MKTYIKKNLKGYYVEFDSLVDTDKFCVGSTWDDFLNGKWVLLSPKQVQFHIDHPDASVKEVLAMQLPTIKEATLDDYRKEKLCEIEKYHDSAEVSSFMVNGESVWLTALDRANYRNSIESARTLGINELSFYIGNVVMNLQVSQAELVLSNIQHYTDTCCSVAHKHKMKVNELTTTSEIISYDYKTGYPKKLNFEV